MISLFHCISRIICHWLANCNLNSPSERPQWTTMKHDNPLVVIFVTSASILSTRSMRLFDAQHPVALWWHRSWSTLAQVMARCLVAPSHYMNQYWLIISGINQRATSQEFLQPASQQPAINTVYIKNYISKTSIRSPRRQWVHLNVWSNVYKSLMNTSDLTHWPLGNFN